MIAEIFGPDLLIVLLLVGLLFGGARLPKLARSLGSAKSEFEKGLREGEPAPPAAPPAPAKVDDEQITISRAEFDAFLAQRDAEAARRARRSEDPAPPAS